MMNSLMVWTVLSLAAPETECPSAQSVSAYLPPGVRAPAQVKIVNGRLSLTVLFPDGQTRKRFGIELPRGCEARAQTIAAVVRAWHLSWRPKPQPRVRASKTHVLVEVRALRRVRRRLLRRIKTATTAISIASRAPPDLSPTTANERPTAITATAAPIAEVAAPTTMIPKATDSAAGVDSRDAIDGSKAANGQDVPAEDEETFAQGEPFGPNDTLKKIEDDEDVSGRPGLPRTNLAVAPPPPRTARILTKAPPPSEPWSAPRWGALAAGLSAIGGAVALNATKAQKPSAPLPLGLYFVGTAVTVATLVAE